MKKTILRSALLAIAGVGLMAGSAMALEIGFDTGAWTTGMTPAVVTADNDITGTVAATMLSDTASDLGIVSPGTYTGLAGWGTTTTGFNYGKTAGLPSEGLDLLTNSWTTTEAGGSIFLILSEVDLTDPGWAGAVGGTSTVKGGAMLEFWAYAVEDNTHWGTGVEVAYGIVDGTGVNNLSGWHAEDNWTVDMEGEYAMQLVAKITHFGAGATSFDLAADPVPEPATMLLFGTGLAGLAGYRRKKSQKA